MATLATRRRGWRVGWRRRRGWRRQLRLGSRCRRPGRTARRPPFVPCVHSTWSPPATHESRTRGHEKYRPRRPTVSRSTRKGYRGTLAMAQAAGAASIINYAEWTRHNQEQRLAEQLIHDEAALRLLAKSARHIRVYLRAHEQNANKVRLPPRHAAARAWSPRRHGDATSVAPRREKDRQRSQHETKNTKLWQSRRAGWQESMRARRACAILQGMAARSFANMKRAHALRCTRTHRAPGGAEPVVEPASFGLTRAETG